MTSTRPRQCAPSKAIVAAPGGAAVQFGSVRFGAVWCKRETQGAPRAREQRGKDGVELLGPLEAESELHRLAEIVIGEGVGELLLREHLRRYTRGYVFA